MQGQGSGKTLTGINMVKNILQDMREVFVLHLVGNGADGFAQEHARADDRP